MKPVLFVTGHAPAYRAAAFAALHEREGIEVALFGGRALHAGPGGDRELPVPHRHVRARALAGLAACGAYRAVVVPTGGRMALLGAWAGARAGRRPLILWASLWSHPRSAAHALSYLPLRRLYRRADAVVTYGPHVSAYVRERGAGNVFEAPQAVDNDFWRAAESGPPPGGPRWPAARPCLLYAGRPDREKGLDTLLAAWREAGLGGGASLVLAGVGAGYAPAAREPSVVCLDSLDRAQLRRAYAAADVLVLPSIATATFREPWGLVVNEAMNRGLPVIASDAVGAVAGGLVRDGDTGLVFAAGDSAALAGAMRRLAGDPRLRARLGARGREDVLRYTHAAWAEGFSRALASVGLSRERW
jgi:glycosyltransferase involved in cell wall biosynthesis